LDNVEEKFFWNFIKRKG